MNCYFDLIGHGVVDNLAKSVTLPMAVSDAKIFHKEVCSMLRALKVKPEDLRGVRLL